MKELFGRTRAMRPKRAGALTRYFVDAVRGTDAA